jgi:hypothetical protein
MWTRIGAFSNAPLNRESEAKTFGIQMQEGLAAGQKDGWANGYGLGTFFSTIQSEIPFKQLLETGKQQEIYMFRGGATPGWQHSFNISLEQGDDKTAEATDELIAGKVESLKLFAVSRKKLHPNFCTSTCKLA